MAVPGGRGQGGAGLESGDSQRKCLNRGGLGVHRFVEAYDLLMGEHKRFEEAGVVLTHLPHDQLDFGRDVGDVVLHVGLVLEAIPLVIGTGGEFCCLLEVLFGPARVIRV